MIKYKNTIANTGVDVVRKIELGLLGYTPYFNLILLMPWVNVKRESEECS